MDPRANLNAMQQWIEEISPVPDHKMVAMEAAARSHLWGGRHIYELQK